MLLVQQHREGGAAQDLSLPALTAPQPECTLQEASARLADPTCRIPNAARFSRRWEEEPFTFGVPSPQFLDFSGPGGILTKECECPTTPPVLTCACLRCAW